MQKFWLEKFLDEWFDGKGISAWTSGSTGEPKKIILSHDAVERSARRTNRYFGITRRSRIHCAISFEFIGGKMMIARSLVSGCRLTYSEPSLHVVLTETEGMGIDLLSVVPAQLPHILDNISDFSGVKRYLIGGSAIDSTLWDRIVNSGIEAWESYGMTETASHIALRRIKGSSAERPRFVPLPGVEIGKCFDGSLRIKDGDIIVKTNDLVKLHSDGSFIITGRKDDIIVSGGLKILPQDIERVLAPFLSSVTDKFYITSRPDPLWTSKLVLAAVAPQERLDEIINIIACIPETLLSKKIKPKEVVILENLPLTSSGKLNRRASLF